MLIRYLCKLGASIVFDVMSALFIHFNIEPALPTIFDSKLHYLARVYMANDIIVDLSFPRNYIKSGFCGFSDTWVYVDFWDQQRKHVNNNKKCARIPLFISLKFTQRVTLSSTYH